MREERDSMGVVLVDDNVSWGAQTQRSLNNFKIGCEKMPVEVIRALALVKSACAEANRDLGKLSGEKCGEIMRVCAEIADGKHAESFPLSVWQTGSGTQTNMNVNEVVSHLSGVKLHPNDDVNMSQSSNDVFPTAMNVAVVTLTARRLIPAVERLADSIGRLAEKGKDARKCGRTHLQDATPLMFGEEAGGWEHALRRDAAAVTDTLGDVRALAIGGTAVGTGINAPDGFGELVCENLSRLTGERFVSDGDKFSALASRGALTVAHGALKALAADLWKIANDIRMLASGPRCGLGELDLPANEPGSSIMPGKVNPTQCEAVTMVAARVMGNDATVGICASQGNFELNVFAPVIIYSYIQSLELLSDVCVSFAENCVDGIVINREKMADNLERSLMNVTVLSPYIGYEKAAEVAKKAYADGCTLREACLALGYLTEKEFEEYYKP